MIKDSDLFRFRKDLKYIVVDTETESLNLLLSRPWEISWLVIEDGQIKEQYQKFPFIYDLKVSKDAARITHFNYNEWKEKSEDPQKVYNLFSTYLYNPDYYVVGFNFLGFDIYQISNFQQYLKLEKNYSYVNRVYDVLSLGRAFKLDLKFTDKKEEILPWMYKLIDFRKKGLKANLSQLCVDFDISSSEDQRHSGLYDIILTNEVFKKLCFNLEIW